MVEKKSESHDGPSSVLVRHSSLATGAVLVEVFVSAGVAGNEHLVLKPLIEAGRWNTGTDENVVVLRRSVRAELRCVARDEARLSRGNIDARVGAVLVRCKFRAEAVASCCLRYEVRGIVSS